MDEQPMADTIVAAFPVDPEAPSWARAFVANVIGLHPRSDDILLATSELVTNVIRHAPRTNQATLEVQRRGAVIRVGVLQEGARFERSEVSADDPHGRGLSIVEAVTDRWGVDANDGLEVWFEVADIVV